MSKFQLKVISNNNESWPFMRGILTHSLVKHGMEFNKAYKVAQQVKRSLSGKEAIAKDELRKIVEDEIKANLGHEDLKKFKQPLDMSLATIKVISEDSSAPFSKGLLARSLMAAGIPPNHTHQMAQEIQQKLYQDRIQEISTKNLYKRTFRKILNESGEETAEFYKLATDINRMDRPMIIYIGGGIGTGKSSLATELASRLDISKVTGTDMIRQIMRTIFTEQMLPALHSSSFEAMNEDTPKSSDTIDTKEGFVAQSVNVNVGVRAMVERAINENTNMILEGVHLLPSLIRFEDLANRAYHIPLVISLSNDKSHRAHFVLRQKRAFNRKAQRYEEQFERIRQIHDYCIETANKFGVDIIENEDFDRSINQLVRMVITKLLQQIDSHRKRTKSKTG